MNNKAAVTKKEDEKKKRNIKQLYNCYLAARTEIFSRLYGSFEMTIGKSIKHNRKPTNSSFIRRLFCTLVKRTKRMLYITLYTRFVFWFVLGHFRNQLELYLCVYCLKNFKRRILAGGQDSG